MRKLAEKYNVPFGTLQRRALKEHWGDKRRNADDKAIEETTQKTAEAVAENAVLLERAKTGLLKLAVDMIEAYPGKAAEIKKKQGGAFLTYRMKDIAAVLSVLEDKAQKGQTADIEDLAPLAELLRDD